MASSPGIAWADQAASAYRAFFASLEGVSEDDPLPPFDSLPSDHRVAWEAVARQVRRCGEVKTAGPTPDESVWIGWTPNSPDPRPGVVRMVAVHALVAGLFLIAALFISHSTRKADAMDGYQTHYNAAFAATQAREHGRAAEEWKRARAAGGSDAECLRNQAEQAWHAKDLPGAESAARELLALVPGSWAGHYTLGLVAKKRGEKVPAERVIAARHFRDAAMYATNDDERRWASRKLSEVTK